MSRNAAHNNRSLPCKVGTAMCTKQPVRIYKGAVYKYSKGSLDHKIMSEFLEVLTGVRGQQTQNKTLLKPVVYS